MAILTNKQLVNECKRMAGMSGKLEKKSGKITYYKERYGYVYGAQGHTYSKELAEKWGAIKRAGKTRSYFVTSCKHWFGRTVVDCSGMIVQAFRSYDLNFGDKSANYFCNSYTTETGAIKTIPEIPGLIVWKSGHIGVYIGGGLVVEARGHKYGVVVSELSSQKWTKWGKLKNVSYQSAPEPKFEFHRALKHKSNQMRGEDVKALQTLLTKANHVPGAIDGYFGKKTLAAVKSYQREKKLVVDGIAGKNTITKLGGVWKG